MHPSSLSRQVINDLLHHLQQTYDDMRDCSLTQSQAPSKNISISNISEFLQHHSRKVIGQLVDLVTVKDYPSARAISWICRNVIDAYIVSDFETAMLFHKKGLKACIYDIDKNAVPLNSPVKKSRVMNPPESSNHFRKINKKCGGEPESLVFCLFLFLYIYIYDFYFAFHIILVRCIKYSGKI